MRVRGELPPDCARFGPDSDGFEVFVVPDVVASLRTTAATHAPDEFFGLLAGRVFQDAAGPYAVIAAMQAGEASRAGRAHVRLDHDEMLRLRSEILRRNPGLDLVGWTHSHTHPSGYSSVDRDEQRTWADPQHLGLLVYMDPCPDTWATAYRGPAARPLRLAGGPAWTSGTQAPAARTLDSLPGSADGAPVAVRRTVHRSRPAGRVVAAGLATIAAAALAAVVLLVAGWLHVNRRLTAIETAIATMQPPATQIATPATCRVQPADSTIVVCTVNDHASTGDVAWHMGDGSTEIGRKIEHDYRKSGWYPVFVEIADGDDTESSTWFVDLITVVDSSETSPDEADDEPDGESPATSRRDHRESY
ncbi:MAG: Mov34/MPN/PAD-1 family protein [Acidimicrobiia bacterium]|nr:Mov34/MPN/PAD-1 family protein [Acidimicrobiia bacterium]